MAGEAANELKLCMEQIKEEIWNQERGLWVWDDRREHQVKVRLADDELERMNALVDRSGLSWEEFIRRRVLSDKKIIVQDERAIHTLVAEVNRIGNNINQIARMANSTGAVSRKFCVRLSRGRRKFTVKYAR